MGLNTYPYSPFPASTDQLHKGDNEQIQAEIDEINGDIVSLENQVNGDAVTYPYADVITIPDAVPSNLADCSVKIEPVQSGSGDPSPTNIRPITGHTEASVQRDGVNLFDGSVTNGYYINESGEYVQDGASAYTDLIKVPNNTNVVFSGVCTQGNAGTKRVHAYDADGNWISMIGDVRPLENNKPFSCGGVTPSNCTYVRLSYYGSTESEWASVRDKDIQLELGSTATPYEPYAGKTYTIALGDTIYGGTVDFDSGVMTVDDVQKVFDGSEDETWTIRTVQPGYTLFEIGLSDTKHSTSQMQIGLCNEFPWNVSLDTDKSYRYYQQTIGIRYDGLTLAEFKEWLSNNELEVTLPLATPTTIQLAPQQIQLLKGQNTLTASTGQISVTVNGVSGAIGAVQTQANDTDEALAELAADIAAQLPTAPTTDGAYVLTVTVADGTPTYSWESAE